MKTSKFQFVNPYLEELNFELNSDYDKEKEKIEMQNSFQVEVKRHEGKNCANVALILETNMENKSAPFKLRARIASDFKWTDMDENVAETMLKLNAPALLLGYLRPIVANVTNVSGFSAYNIPFINFKE